MGQIRVATGPLEEDDPFAVDIDIPLDIEWAGSFDTTTAQYWCGDGQPRRVEVPGYPGEYELVPREKERLWHTADGRWVITGHGGPGTAYLITEGEAEQWFRDNGYTPEDREIYVRSGHRS